VNSPPSLRLTTLLCRCPSHRRRSVISGPRCGCGRSS
jgi:hypothetical protein